MKKNTIVQLPTSPVVNHMKYGRPVIKKLGDNGEALQGAIFKVEYSAGSNWAPEGVWFLKSDENGNATFDSDHLVQNFEGQESSEFWCKKDSNVPVLPVGYIKVTEVKAPDNYEVDPTPQYLSLIHISEPTRH